LLPLIRLEQVNIRSIRSQAKVAGTVATVSGAMIMTLIKGPLLFGTHGGNDQSQNNGTSTQHTIMGFIMITIGCFCWASFMILQVKMMNKAKEEEKNYVGVFKN